MNMHLSYKPPSPCRIMFWSGGRPRQFSHQKNFRYLVVPSGGFRKGKILQGRQLPPGLPVIVQSCLRRKGDVTEASVHAPIQVNSTYVQTVRRSIYETRRPEHPHFSIHQYERRHLGPSSRPHYIPLNLCNTKKIVLSDPGVSDRLIFK